MHTIVDDTTLVEKIAHAGLIDIIISLMQRRLMNDFALSQEHESKLRETIYLKIKLLPEIKSAFLSVLNEDMDILEEGEKTQGEEI